MFFKRAILFCCRFSVGYAPECLSKQPMFANNDDACPRSLCLLRPYLHPVDQIRQHGGIAMGASGAHLLLRGSVGVAWCNHVGNWGSRVCLASEEHNENRVLAVSRACCTHPMRTVRDAIWSAAVIWTHKLTKHHFYPP